MVFILGAICSRNLKCTENDTFISPSLVGTGQNEYDDNNDEVTGCTGIENGKYS